MGPNARAGFYLEGLHYRLELVRCGKPACKRCPHGPYWYSYSNAACFLKKRYVGKRLPPAVLLYAPSWVAEYEHEALAGRRPGPWPSAG